MKAVSSISHAAKKLILKQAGVQYLYEIKNDLQLGFSCLPSTKLLVALFC